MNWEMIFRLHQYGIPHYRVDMEARETYRNGNSAFLKEVAMLRSFPLARGVFIEELARMSAKSSDRCFLPFRREWQRRIYVLC